MDRYLFYMYLKYLKDNKLTFWYELWKQPKMAIVLFAIVIISGISLLVFIFINKYLILISIIVEIVSCVILYFYTENYRITCSKNKTEEYRKYCKDIKRWLNGCGIRDKEAVEVLHSRVIESIEQLKSLDKESQERTDKWLQALIIPVVLAIITTVISNVSDIAVMFNNTLIIIICFVSIYCIFTSTQKISSFPQKRMLEQLNCFASDLQGVLDTQFTDSIFK